MSEPFIGQIQMFGFNFAPRGWLTCAGQILPISQNTALFSLLGTTFGGDGRTTFGVPDLRSRSAVGGGMGTGPGLDDVRWGEKSGGIQHTMTTAQMPSHNHPVAPAGNSGGGDDSNPNGGYPATAATDLYAESSNVIMGGFTSGNAGSNQAFNIRNPYLGLYHCIAIFGLFPSRN
jgi:microcystin-dependent protein